MTKRKLIPLFTRTTLMILGGVVMTGLVYLLICLAGMWAVDKLYMAESAVESRNRSVAQQLQRYVDEKHIDSTDYEAIAAWFDTGVDADLIIYEDDGAVEAGSWGHDAFPAEDVEDEDYARWGYTLLSIDFANGTHRVAVAEYSDVRMRELVRTSAAVVSFIVFVGSLLLYMLRISRLLRGFSEDVTAVSRSEADRVEERRGFVELSVLAQDVNQMHDVITEQTRSAQNALQANRELITALSHDIRNPLTSLIGYLDLLGMESESLTEEQRRYLSASAEKADRIRALTDEMFRYFLIFSDRKPALQIERCDAQIMVEQMLGEQAIELESLGYIVHRSPLAEPCWVETDTTMLFRVIDNLFSNLRKYADPDQPVELSGELRGDVLHIRVANTVLAVPPNNVESNRIGLRTCAAIMELLSGTFSAKEEQGIFTVELTLPAAADAAVSD